MLSREISTIRASNRQSSSGRVYLYENPLNHVRWSEPILILLWLLQVLKYTLHKWLFPQIYTLMGIWFINWKEASAKRINNPKTDN